MTTPADALDASRPIDHLHVGDVWGDGPGDKRVRVHRVDVARDRAQFRMADDPGKGKRWAVNHYLKPGDNVKIRKVIDGERIAMNGTVLTAQENGVTLGGFQLTTWHEPDATPAERRPAPELEPQA